MKHLNTFVYQLLLEGPQTGYSLAKEIESRTGWKPSWGSIYPHFEHLIKENQVTVKEVGRSKQYTLTADGKKKAKENLSKNQEIIMEIVERMKVLQTLCGEDMSMPIAFLTELGKGENRFMPITESTGNMKKELYRMWKEELIKKNSKKINDIFNDTTKRLKAIK